MLQDFIWPFLWGFYVAATLVQLVVWWGIFRRLGSRDWGVDTPKTQSQIPNPGSPITIILCARNEAENLQRYLPKILAQEYSGDWEIIVVDDASEDDTSAVLQFFLEKNARLHVVRISDKKHFGKKHALAQGIAAAKFDNLLLTDADCEPASVFWLTHMAAALEEKPETEIVVGYGPMKRSDNRWLNSWSRFETAHTAIQYFSFALAGMPYMGVGRNLAFKKMLFKRVGGFSAHVDVPSGDDDLLVNAAASAKNTAIRLHPESFVFSETKKTWHEWAQQKRRHLAAGKRYRWKHQVVLTLVSASQVFHYFLFLLLLLGGFGMVSAVLLFCLRGFSVVFLYGKILPKLRESSLLSRAPIYDTLMAVYYGAFVPLSLIAHKTFQWK